ncbi:hypothetical protein CJD36_002340 [Flavipsychrobacter stenotrophus]|uniref:Uncharacterized protein n=1 Tax=Flavipsychrobacter stenotrophus TaxID=2077091 RepID=A0A2S7T1B6_9BACT|nr:hypothetical protein [Flavipsychrobacter stenotrophus]PQJ12605.1 hypothetical protein CJD36_002340 [Flavipsychrobacter stenotrophus]
MSQIALPQNIKEIFFKTIKGEIAILDFEQWLYADKEIENYLTEDDYLDLISLNFKKSGAKYELWELLKKHIDLGEFETYKMLRLLKDAQEKNNNLPEILMDFYDLYCRGYNFLDDLGMGFGLALEVPMVRNINAETWDELTPTQQQNLLDSFSPRLEKSIENAINWLETGKIILTGKIDEIGHYGYNDHRTEDERKSIFQVKVPELKTAGSCKKWWMFWK